ncbi:hypothetical protein [Micromonospora sp. NPDC049203]|uniref:hypothetical protein n=1 Tax=Micromonospora sp. NPDC049203 TaxID=3364267 RepID=UPI00371439BE
MTVSNPAVLLLTALVVLVVLYGLATVTIAPLTVYALLGGVLAGLALGLAEAVAVFGGVVDVPRVRTPHDEFTARLPRGRRPDYAWVHYAHRQAGYDLRHLAERCHGRVGGMWRRGWQDLPTMPRYHLRLQGPARDPDVPRPAVRSRTWTIVLFWPLLALPVAGLTGLTVGVVAALLLVGAVVALVAVPAWFWTLAVAALLRAGERRRRRRRGTRLCCPRCYFLIDLPEYRCSGRHGRDVPAGAERHRMLRPGLQGLRWRRCGCGRKLPVGPAAAGPRLPAYCPKCQTSLADGSGASSEVRIALFGAAAAGKSTLVEALTAGLVAHFPGGQCLVSRVEGGGQPPRPLVVTVTVQGGTGTAQRLQFFDAPARGLLDPVVCRSYAYLYGTRHFVFVLDPLAAGLVGGVDVPEPCDPLDAYELVVGWLRNRGVDTGRCRLAVVVSRADHLRRLLGGTMPAPDRVRCWLDERGLDQLVITAARDFAQVGYFLSGRDEPAPVEPLRWLLRGRPGVGAEVARALR